LKGRFDFHNFKITTDDGGNIEFSASVSPESKYAVREMVKEMRREDKDYTATISIKRNSRTLDQNALMWALLTIYADAQGGGRRGSVTPEDIYYRMLEKYGVAAFIMTLPDAKPQLELAFRVVKQVDTRDYNGKEMTIFKCYYGSSKYDTKQMADLIDGIFDELAVIGINVDTSHDVSGFYEDWTKYKEANNA
jgi:hypothetical protein